MSCNTPYIHRAFSVVEAPVLLSRDLFAMDGQGMAGGELQVFLEDRPRRNRNPKRKNLIKGDRVNLPKNIEVSKDGLDLGSKDECIFRDRVNKGPDPTPLPRDEESI